MIRYEEAAHSQTTHQCLAEEILLQRALSTRVVLQRDIPVRAERARKHSNVPKHRFPIAAQIVSEWP
jgi:hypothetical protein